MNHKKLRLELETRKLLLIEEGLKGNKQWVMDELEEGLKGNRKVVRKKHEFNEIAGLMNDEDANEMIQIIEDSCEKIDLDGWK